LNTTAVHDIVERLKHWQARWQPVMFLVSANAYQ
jgi:hypothetical protein